MFWVTHAHTVVLGLQEGEKPRMDIKKSLNIRKKHGKSFSLLAIVITDLFKIFHRPGILGR